jgi:hypothetical protein
LAIDGLGKADRVVAFGLLCVEQAIGRFGWFFKIDRVTLSTTDHLR